MRGPPRRDRPTGERGRPIRTGRADRPVIQPPSVALRVVMLGAITAAVLAVLLFRLWFLQILTGQQYVAQANDNRLRSVKIVAPRGNILDSKGRVMVDNRPGLAIGIRPMDVPAGQLPTVVDRVAKELHRAPAKVRRQLVDQTGIPFKQLNMHTGPGGFDLVVVKEDTSKRVVSYVLERKQFFPGVEVRQSYVRDYPMGTVGAHFLGQLGEIDAKELKQPAFRGYLPGDVIGQSGVESSYDRWLRGTDGSLKVEVDSMGRPKQQVPGGRLPQVGDSLALTVDSKVQAAAQQAIAYGITQAHLNGDYRAGAGAAVVLDAKTGGVVAMASYPSFDPSWFSGGISAKHWKKLNNDPLRPMTNRADQGLYPVGSTFKVIDSVAALEEGVVTPATQFLCTGSYTPPHTLDHSVFHCWSYPVGHGWVSIIPALTESCDVYFYNVGYHFYQRHGTELEDWAKRLGLGHLTGLDIPGESAGLVPTPQWKNATFTKQTDPTNWQIDRLWKPGDSINLAIGQGNLQTTPLQLAVAYAAVANGGYLVKPHFGDRVVDSSGRLVQRLNLAPPKKLDIAPQWIDVIKQGLLDAATTPLGTSYPVFGSYPIKVCGKTGTAQVAGKGDYAWYASFAPASDPKYVVVVLIEQGGHGGTAAAPAARMIYDSLFDVHAGVVQGATHTD